MGVGHELRLGFEPFVTLQTRPVRVHAERELVVRPLGARPWIARGLVERVARETGHDAARLVAMAEAG